LILKTNQAARRKNLRAVFVGWSVACHHQVGEIRCSQLRISQPERVTDD